MKARYAAAVLLAAAAPPSFAAPSLRRHDPDDQEGPGARAPQGGEAAPGGGAPDPDARALQEQEEISFYGRFAYQGYDPARHPSFSEIARGTDFAWMFRSTDMSQSYCCGHGPHYSLYRWDVSRGTRFDRMFMHSGDIGNLDLSRWDVSSGTSFVAMFEGTNVHNVDFSNWEIEVENALDVSRMFKDATVKDDPMSCPRVKFTSYPRYWRVNGLLYYWDQDVPVPPRPWDGFIRYCPGLCSVPNLQWARDMGYRGENPGDYSPYAFCS